MLPARAPQMFRCAVGYAGVYDLQMLLRDADKKSRDGAGVVWRRYIGDDVAGHRRDSPVLLADRIKVPVLLIHGTADDITPVAQGRAMRDALEQAGNPAEFWQVRSEGHGFFLPENKLRVLRLLETFLARHIGAGRK
jgi:dipeptidyl aminopeptidase/acylaminoacyl peptidase